MRFVQASSSNQNSGTSVHSDNLSKVDAQVSDPRSRLRFLVLILAHRKISGGYFDLGSP